MPDTDTFVILLHYTPSVAINVLLDTGTGKNHHFVDVIMLAKSLVSDHATVVMGLYTFTSDDCNATFKGKGKVTPLKKL